jgi:RNA polymerase sigma-70 factor (ECF subfamily)
MMTLDRPQFELLYAEYSARLVRFISSHTNDVDDIAAETWFKAWRGRAVFRGDSLFYTWLCTIAINEIRQRVRSNALRRARAEMVPLDALTDSSIPTVPASVERALIARQKIEKIMDRVPARDLPLFHMRFVLGYGPVEIGAITGIQQETVKTRIYRSLNHSTTSGPRVA